MNKQEKEDLAQKLRNYFLAADLKGLRDELPPPEITEDGIILATGNVTRFRRDRDGPQAKKLKIALNKYFEDYGATDDELLDAATLLFLSALRQSVDIEPKAQLVKEIISEENIKKCVDEVIKYFTSLPREYLYLFPTRTDVCDLSDRSLGSVLFTTEVFFLNFFEQVPVESYTVYGTDPNFKLANTSLSHTIDPYVHYLCISVKGLFLPSNTQGASAKAIKIAKVFLLLSRIDVNSFMDLGHQPYTSGIVFDQSVLTSAITSKRKTKKKPLTKFVPGNGSAFEIPDTLRIALSTWEDNELAVSLDGPEETSRELRFLYDTAAKGIEDMRRSDFEGTLVRACEWTFDALYVSSDIHRVVLVSMAFEALLGNDLRGQQAISARLSDRLAFFVGENNQDRCEVNSTFDEFYKLRSTIVHGSRDQLKVGDQKIVEKAFKLLERVFTQEFKSRGIIDQSRELSSGWLSK